MRNKIAVFLLTAGILASRPAPAAAQWEPAGKLGVSKVTALVLAGTRLFAGTTRHGVFVSADQGATWKATGPGLPPGEEVGDLAAGENILFAIVGGRAFVSTSSGASWRPAGPGSTRRFYFWHMAVCGRTVVAGTNRGLLVSEDNGEHWRAPRPGLPQKARSQCLLARGPDLYAGTSEGAFVSTDRGETWRPVGPAGGLGQQVNCLDVSGDVIYVGTPDGVYSATFDGPAWKDIGSGLEVKTTIAGLISRGRHLYATAWRGFFHSTDAGASWRLVDSQWARSQVNDIETSATHIFVGTESGLFISGDEGQTWTSAGAGLPIETHILSLAAIGSSLFVGTETGVSLSTDNGESWRPVYSDVMVEGLVAIGPDLVANAAFEDHVSHDNGATWEASDQLPFGMEGPMMEGGECLYRLNHIYDRFSYSLDGGKSWADAALPLHAACVLASGSSLFAGTGESYGKGADPDAAAEAANSVFRSADGGKTWQRVGAPFSANINDLAAIGPYIFIGTDRGLYVCGDSGRCPEATKLELAGEVAVGHFKVVGNTLIVGMNKGVYFVGTAAGGRDWVSLNTRFPKGLVPNSFAVIGRYLFASTAHDGIWRYLIPRD